MRTIIKNANPWMIAGLSWAIPGLGQFCVGRWLRGLIFLTLCVLFDIAYVYFILPSLIMLDYWGFFYVSVLFFSGFHILAGLDAFLCAKKSLPYDSQNPESKVWFAVFLSLVWPGLGHAYFKRWFFFVVYFAINVALLSSDLHIVACRILVQVVACIHIARSFTDAACKKDFRRFVTAVFLILFTVRIAIPVLRAEYIITGYFVQESCMAPKIKVDDMTLINRLAYLFDEPQIGDIVEINQKAVETGLDSKLRSFLKLDKSGPYTFTKRIIASGGMAVQVKEDGVYVDNLLQKSYMVDYASGPNHIKIDEALIKRIAMDQPFIVPENCFFVLGDNTKNSVDSRDFGAVPRSMIRGKVIKIYSPIGNDSK